MNQFQHQHQLTNALLAAAAMLNQRQQQLHNTQQQQQSQQHQPQQHQPQQHQSQQHQLQQQANVARQTKPQSNSQVQPQSVNGSHSSTSTFSSQQPQSISKQSIHTTSLPVQSPQLTNSMPPKKRRSVSPPVDVPQSSAKRLCANNSTSPSVSFSSTALPVTSHHSNGSLSTTSINLVRPTFPTSSITSTQSSPRKRSCTSESSPPDSNNNTLDTNQNDLNADLLDFDSDDEEGGDRKGKQGQRNYRKMIIEKRRRDRINHSLNELRRLVPAAFERTGSAKLEKAEILQLTVEHLKQLRAKLKESESPKQSVDYHNIGFQECADEVARFLTNQEKMNLQEQVRTRVLSHLTNLSAEVPSSPTLSPTLPNLNQARVSDPNQHQQHHWPLPLAHWLNTSKQANNPISPASSSAVSPANSNLSSSSTSPVASEQSSRSSSVSSAPEAHVSSTQPSLAPQAQLSRVGRAKSLCRQVQQNSVSARQSTSSQSTSSTIQAQSTLINNVSKQPQQHLMPQLQQPQLAVPQVMQRINPLLLDAQSQLILAAQQRIAAINQSALTNQSSNNRAPLNLSLTSTLY